MKTWIPISMMLVVFAVPSFGQAAPTATEVVTPAGSSPSPKLSWVDGTVHYALSASEAIQHGFYGAGDTTSSTNLSGNVGWVSMSKYYPTSLVFAGGVLFGQGGQGVSTYQNISVAQTVIHKRWVFNVTDSFSFLPQSPVAGYSGIGGVGDLGPVPVEGPADGPAGGVLTFSGNRIANGVTGTLSRNLTARTSISGTGSYQLLHFLDKNAGLDTSSLTGSVGLNHTINVRNSVGLSAYYTTYDTTGFLTNVPGFTTGNTINYQTKGINVSYSRSWTRLLSTYFSAGPTWIQSSAAPLIPDSLNYYISAGMNYSRKLFNLNLNYSHGVNNGSGVYAGGLSDTVSASTGHNFGRNWATAAAFSYVHTTSLFSLNPTINQYFNGAADTEYGSLQVSRALTRTVSFFGSYTIQNQSLNQAFAAQNAFVGISHTFGFGVTWAPQSKRLGEF